MAQLLRVRVSGDGFPGGPAFMTYYFEPDSDPATGTQAENVVARVASALEDGKLLWSNQQHFMVSPEVDVIDAGTGLVVTSFATGVPPTVTGGQAIPPGPNTTGGLLVLHTSGVVAGRHVRGRSFLVPIAASLTATAEPTTDLKAKIAVYGEALLDYSNDATVNLAVWSRPYEGRTEPTVIAARTGTSHEVSAVSASPRFAILSSRRT